MKKPYLKKILILTMLLISFNSFACDCDCEGDCSFSVISNRNELVAIVKVLEYSDFLDYEIDGYDKKMPFSMTVEIIKKYKGTESKNRIKIWGDNGILCRPYISNFEVGKYYLISPLRLENDSDEGNKGDYDFFACWTDYLTVDYENGIAHGEYTKRQNKISLKDFESGIKK
jgi:hypothetical protein